MWKSGFRSLIIFTMLLPSGSNAQIKLPEPSPVPIDVSPAATARLNSWRSALVQARDSVLQRVAAHRGECSAVEEGSAAANKCLSERNNLIRDADNYNVQLKDYETELALTKGKPSSEEIRHTVGSASSCPGGAVIVHNGNDSISCFDPRADHGMPKVDLSATQMPGQREVIQTKLTELRTKTKAYEEQLRAIESTRNGLQFAANEIDELTQDLIIESSGHALSVISAAVEELGKSGGMPAETARSIGALLNTTKAGLNGIASARAGDKQEHMKKAIDAAFNLKNLIQVSERIIPAQQLSALKHATDTIPKLLSLEQDYVNMKGGKDTLKEYSILFDDVFAAGAQLFAPLKIAHSTAHVIDGEIAFWQLRHDREDVESAFVKSQTAKNYYLQRIAEAEEMTNFYETELRKNRSLDPPVAPSASVR